MKKKIREYHLQLVMEDDRPGRIYTFPCEVEEDAGPDEERISTAAGDLYDTACEWAGDMGVMPWRIVRKMARLAFRDWAGVLWQRIDEWVMDREEWIRYQLGCMDYEERDGGAAWQSK